MNPQNMTLLKSTNPPHSTGKRYEKRVHRRQFAEQLHGATDLDSGPDRETERADNDEHPLEEIRQRNGLEPPDDRVQYDDRSHRNRSYDPGQIEKRFYRFRPGGDLEAHIHRLEDHEGDRGDEQHRFAPEQVPEVGRQRLLPDDSARSFEPPGDSIVRDDPPGHLRDDRDPGPRPDEIRQPSDPDQPETAHRREEFADAGKGTPQSAARDHVIRGVLDAGSVLVVREGSETEHVRAEHERVGSLRFHHSTSGSET